MDFSIGSQKLDTLQTNLKDVQGKIETSKTTESGFFEQKTQIGEECMVYKHLTDTIKQHGVNGRLTEAEQKFVNNFESRIARFGLEYQDGKLVPKGN